MIRGVRVFARVAVRRVVTAQGDSAFLASTQMHPTVAGLDALFTHATLRLLHRLDCG